MTRRLTLRSERLIELTDDELRLAAGAAASGSYSGCLRCVLSLEAWCLPGDTRLCTV